MASNDEIAEAAKEWWRHFTTPESGYEGGWRQRNDMVHSREIKLHNLLRKACGAKNNVRGREIKRFCISCNIELLDRSFAYRAYCRNCYADRD